MFWFWLQTVGGKFMYPPDTIPPWAKIMKVFEGMTLSDSF